MGWDGNLEDIMVFFCYLLAMAAHHGIPHKEIYEILEAGGTFTLPDNSPVMACFLEAVRAWVGGWLAGWCWARRLPHTPYPPPPPPPPLPVPLSAD